MSALQSLSLRFLLPSWSSCQLKQFRHLTDLCDIPNGNTALGSGPWRGHTENKKSSRQLPCLAKSAAVLGAVIKITRNFSTESKPPPRRKSQGFTANVRYDLSEAAKGEPQLKQKFRGSSGRTSTDSVQSHSTTKHALPRNPEHRRRGTGFSIKRVSSGSPNPTGWYGKLHYDAPGSPQHGTKILWAADTVKVKVTSDHRSASDGEPPREGRSATSSSVTTNLNFKHSNERGTPPRDFRWQARPSIDGEPVVAENLARIEVAHQRDEKELSLLEELFPEEAKKLSQPPGSTTVIELDLPRLPPLDFEDLQRSLEDSVPHDKLTSKLQTRDASMNTFRQESTTVLVLARASTGLSDVDFRRLVPRGEHIEDWRGPGDYLKVIPVRDHSTLSPRSLYYLLFPNPASARAYQNNVLRLHNLSRSYSYTSLDFDILTGPKKTDDHGQDIHALLQDYALVPPSVRLTLRLLAQPYTANVRRLLDNLGHPQLSALEGKSVLFWIDGYQPSRLSVHTMLAKDGQDRGLQWGPLVGRGSLRSLDVSLSGEEDNDDTDDKGTENGLHQLGEERGADSRPKKPQSRRWAISFEDEAEARRFVRVWHKQAYTFPLETESPNLGDPSPLVHAEFIW